MGQRVTPASDVFMEMIVSQAENREDTWTRDKGSTPRGAS